LIEGKYPNYEAVIPNNNTNVLQIDRLESYKKMRNISLYAINLPTSSFEN
jgi:DNA polymerase-3 subunit beta